MRSVPFKMQSETSSLSFELPIAGPILDLTVPEFQRVASCYYDIAGQTLLIIDTLLKHPEFMDTVYPAMRALSDMVSEELTKSDQEQAQKIRLKMNGLAEFYGKELDEEGI